MLSLLVRSSMRVGVSSDIGLRGGRVAFIIATVAMDAQHTKPFSVHLFRDHCPNLPNIFYVSSPYTCAKDTVWLFR